MVNWGFLYLVMGRKGFGVKWRLWIRGCLSSVAFSFIINGQPKQWFRGHCGLRQGDPLSPFLFTLVVDVLSRMLERGFERGLVRGLMVGDNGCHVSHLQFADDTILFLPHDKANFLRVLSILQVFQLVSGLRLNLGKCGLAGLNIHQEVVDDLAGIVGCEVLNWPLVYLGVPLGGNPRSESFWEPMVQRISKKLDTWKGAYYSLGGRITLIQASLSYVPVQDPS